MFIWHVVMPSLQDSTCDYWQHYISCISQTSCWQCQLSLEWQNSSLKDQLMIKQWPTATQLRGSNMGTLHHSPKNPMLQTGRSQMAWCRRHQRYASYGIAILMGQMAGHRRHTSDRTNCTDSTGDWNNHSSSVSVRHCRELRGIRRGSQWPWPWPQSWRWQWHKEEYNAYDDNVYDGPVDNSLDDNIWRRFLLILRLL